MRITSCRVLFGPYAPDPTYRNLYKIQCYDPTGKTPSEIAYAFYDELRISHDTPTPRYDVPFGEGESIYAVGENERGFTVDLPTDDGFPDRPLYLIMNTADAGDTPVYRFAFVMSYQRIGEYKVRCTCLFDQWTENYDALTTCEFTFTRTHQRRYIDRSATPRTKLYNGLSDPIPEGMVQGTTETDPVKVYGASTITTSDANGHVAIPLWLYWRLAITDFYYKNTYDGDWGDPRRLLGVDPPKFAVPVLATCVGIIDYDPATGLSEFRPTFRVLKSDNSVLTNCGEAFGGTESEYSAMAHAIDTIGKGHPYIVQSWMTTIAPFDISISFTNIGIGVPSVHFPVVKIRDPRFDPIMTPGDGKYYKIGAADAGGLEVNNGTFISLPITDVSPFPTGVRKTVTLRTDTQSGAFSDSYEPKIEESPYEGKTLLLYGAEIDISPTPANPKISLSYEIGAHGDLVLKSGDTEIYRANGVCSQYGVDAATDSLTSWLVSNYQTYQNAKLWKTINTAVGSAVSLVGGAVSGNPGAIVGGGIKAATAYGETLTGERARYADLSASPNATTLASENAFDNFPFLDLPRIKSRTIPSAIKTNINNYWKIYGYPDNRTGSIEGIALTRENYNYVQGSLLRPIPDKYPAEIADILSAIRTGVWVWDSTLWSAVPPIPTPPGFIRHWYTTNRNDNLLSTENKEVL